MKTILSFLTAVSFTFLLGQCTKDPAFENPDIVRPLDKIIFPERFDFSTTKVVDISLTAPEFLIGSIFEIWYRNHDQTNEFILRGTFDQNGKYQMNVAVPVIVDTLFVSSKSFGLEKLVTLPLDQKVAEYDYTIHFNSPREFDFIPNTRMKSGQVTQFAYLGSYTANGYPSYLFQVNDHAWKSLLSNLNQTFPEGLSVPQTKPAFMESNKVTNLVLKERTNVYVTFAGEGTGLESAFGYFIYDGSKPVNLQHKVIFPNASAPGSGGSLHSGDKVLLGEFPANTVLGWFLVPGGWDKQSKSVRERTGIYYSVPSFNNEPSSELNQHMILMKDIQNEVIVLGFEDTPRSSATCDNDFNDVVVYITLDRLEAADLSNVNNTTSPVDTDGDGIIDSQDQYPLDPSRAFNNGGGGGSTGSLAFEDLWPYKGDYDFNDLVIDYRFNPITDASNLIKTLEIQLVIRNIGGSYRNGFGIEFPIPASSVERVSGTRYTREYLNIAPNGIESGRGNAIIFPFDDGWDVKGQSLTVSVDFVTAVSSSILGTYPYNPFMVVNQVRGREIHLPDNPPTEGADNGYFGQGADFSRPSSGLYYRSPLNLPWAINVTSDYAVPVEKSPINKGYLRFVDWAQSAGSQYPDWYLDLPGYRDLIFLD